MTTLEKIERLQGLQQSLEGCTRPCKGHTDPLSINDCWNWMREILEELKDTEQSRQAAVSGMLATSKTHENNCKDCGVKINNERKTGYCYLCDPGVFD